MADMGKGIAGRSCADAGAWLWIRKAAPWGKGSGGVGGRRGTAQAARARSPGPPGRSDVSAVTMVPDRPARGTGRGGGRDSRGSGMPTRTAVPHWAQARSGQSAPCPSAQGGRSKRRSSPQVEQNKADLPREATIERAPVERPRPRGLLAETSLTVSWGGDVMRDFDRRVRKFARRSRARGKVLVDRFPAGVDLSEHGGSRREIVGASTRG